MGWFLYDNGLRLERVKSVIYTSKQFVMLLQVELTGCAIVILPQKKNITLSLAMPAISNNKIRISLTVFIFIYSFTVTIVYCTDPNYSFEINRELSRENYKVFERTVL